MNEAKQTLFERLSCGCLVACDLEGGAVWIEHPDCILNPSTCKIDEYYKRHKPCTICGKCITCFSHNECKSIKNLHKKILNYIFSFLFNVIYKIKLLLYKNKT
jgi:hypothetical protein